MQHLDLIAGVGFDFLQQFDAFLENGDSLC